MKKQEEEKLRANIIRELKKNHPKGFCYICGKGKSATLHHLREITTRKGKVNGIIPLCRDCHDAIESMKGFTKLKQAYKRGYEKSQEDKMKNITEEQMKKQIKDDKRNKI